MDHKFWELQALYDSLPGVPCILGCGVCCATPSVTPLEFIYLFRSMLEQVPRPTIISWIQRGMTVHPWGGNNFLCRFQTLDRNKGCLVHPYRPLACRLFGLPVLDRLKIENLEKCPVMDPAACPDVPLPALQKWLLAVEDLNRDFPEYYAEPYWLVGLNIECWLAVYLDPLLDMGVFGRLKNILHEQIDLSFLTEHYRDTTRLKEKIDKITLFYMLFSQGLSAESREILVSIRDDYPATGTYFTEEAAKFLEIIVDKTG
jgi:Fe-S-cluster containining protein